MANIIRERSGDGVALVWCGSQAILRSSIGNKPFDNNKVQNMQFLHLMVINELCSSVDQPS